MLFFLLLNFEASFQTQKIQKTDFHISLEVINSELKRTNIFMELIKTQKSAIQNKPERRFINKNIVLQYFLNFRL